MESQLDKYISACNIEDHIDVDIMLEICEICENKIPEGTGDEFMDKSCGYKFWLCDECIEEGNYY